MSTEGRNLDLVVTQEAQPNRPDGAGMAREAMQRLGVAPGEYVAVEGRTRTVASVTQANVEADGVALGPSVLENATVDPGDRVTVSKATVDPADRVTVAPTRPVDVREGEIPLARALAGRPVSTDDALDVALMDGTLSLSFVVTDTVPSGPVLVTEQTRVVTRDGVPTDESTREMTLEDVGGLSDAISALRDAVVFPLEQPERFEHFGEGPTSGVLVTGPAGSGKTLLADAISGEVDAHEIWLDAADVAGLGSTDVGEECSRLVREARARSPTIVVLDELDEIAPAGDRATDRDRRIAAQVRSVVGCAGRRAGGCGRRHGARFGAGRFLAAARWTVRTRGLSRGSVAGGAERYSGGANPDGPARPRRRPRPGGSPDVRVRRRGSLGPGNGSGARGGPT